MRGKHITRGFALAGVTGLTLTTTLLATPATARAELPADGAAKSIVSHDNTLTRDVTKLMKGNGLGAEAEALKSYWTPARMKAAKSFDNTPTMTRTGKAPKQQAKTQQSTPKGAFGSVAPSKSNLASKLKGTKTIAPQYYQPNLPSNHPTARTNGKVFFSRGGGNYVCSASIVNSEGKSLVWTAGHCLGEDGVWSTNVAFVPAYSNGAYPYGIWYAKNLTTTSQWFYNHAWGYDVGAATMQANFGYRIADYLSAQGMMWNYTPKTYTAAAFGYPQASPFNGQYLYRADGSTYDPNDGTIYMYSGLTGGSSGGPWFRNYDANSGYGYVNGHNDFIYTDSPSWMYSPYYGNQVADLYNAVRYQSADSVSGSTPTISGTAKVGSTLVASPGSWTPAPVSLTYQWKANGSSIAGATGSTLSVPASALGKAITVTVTGTKTGYLGMSKTSSSTGYVVPGTLTGATPKISGTVKVGKKLTAKPGTWSPSGTTLSYQWYRNSTKISGATKSTYKLVKADKKKKMTVKVTGKKTGYTTLTKKSAKTKKVT